MKTLWTEPRCTEIKMDAEIGSYQADDEGRGGFFSDNDDLAQASGGRLVTLMELSGG